MSARSCLCLCSQVNSSTVQLSYSGNAPFYLQLSKIYNPDWTPVNGVDSFSMVEYFYEEGYGVVRRLYWRSDIRELNAAVPQGYTHFSKLPGENPHVATFVAFAEAATILRRKKLLDMFLAHNPASNVNFYISTLAANLNEQTLEWVVNNIKAKLSEVGQELLQMQKDFYGVNASEFPYAEMTQNTDVPNDSWLMHAFASLFGVVIDVLTADSKKRRFYPNADCYSCPVVTLYGDAWLYPKLPEQESGRKFFQYLTVDNLLHRVKDAYRSRVMCQRCTNISALAKSLEACELAESVYISSMAEVKATACDEVTQFVCTAAAGLKPLGELIRQRTQCTMKNCRNLSEHYLPCDHGLCKLCLIKALHNNFLHCAVCSETRNDWKMTPPVLQKERNEAVASEAARVCSKCKTELKTRDFPLPKKYKNRIYQLECAEALCTHCLELCVRDGSGQCPICTQYVNIHEEEVLEMTCRCFGCKKKKNLIKQFPTVSCVDHRYCVECVSQLKFIDCCPNAACSRTFTSKERQVYASFSTLKCTNCSLQLRRDRIVLNENRNCPCVLCQKCLASLQRGSLDVTTCPSCKAPFQGEAIILQSYQNAVASAQVLEFPIVKEFFEEVAAWKDRLKKCPVCYDPIVGYLDTVYGGKCLHVFHRNCFKDSIEQDTLDIIQRDLKRPVKCPIYSCKGEVSAVHLTGNLALMDQDMFDKYGNYTALQTHKEFICGQAGCKEVDYIEKELLHFACAHCHFDQCVNCKAPWTPDHNEKACQYTIDQANIRERFTEPEDCNCNNKGCDRCLYVQCPGCKLPYIKDDHCDHVTCMNAECKAVFCFQCACLRKPTLEHCNTWHRRQCPNFPQGETEDASAKIVKGEKFRKDCPECVRLGEMCKPPPNLKRIRRFDLSEY